MQKNPLSSEINLVSKLNDNIDEIFSWFTFSELLRLRLVSRSFENIANRHLLKILQNQRIIQVIAAEDKIYLLRTNGTLWFAGKMDFSGSHWWNFKEFQEDPLSLKSPSTPTFIQVPNISNIRSIAQFSDGILALTGDGNVWFDGCLYTFKGHKDRIKLENEKRGLWRMVTGLNKIKKIAAGASFILALKDDGTLLRIEEFESNGIPEIIQKDVTDICAGSGHGIALKTNGTVWTFGRNEYGQLGLGHNKEVGTIKEVTSLSNISKIAAGAAHNLALLSNGKLFAWGHNKFGELGLGHNTDCFSPEEVKNLPLVQTIVVQSYQSFAISNDGSVYIWGDNGIDPKLIAPLKLGHSLQGNKPQKVLGLAQVQNIFPSYYRGYFFRKINGSLTSMIPHDVLLDNNFNRVIVPPDPNNITFRLVEEFQTNHKKTNAIIKFQTSKASWDLSNENASDLILELNLFLKPPAWCDLASTTATPQHALATALRDYIQMNRGYLEIKSEIWTYQQMNNKKNESQTRIAFDKCLNKMLSILDKIVEEKTEQDLHMNAGQKF